MPPWIPPRGYVARTGIARGTSLEDEAAEVLILKQVCHAL